MANAPSKTPEVAKTEVAAFLDRLKATVPAVSASPDTTGRTGGRLIFALDATASRQKTWDAACRVQGEMFEATAAIGGLAAQLVFYRGFEECKASKWVRSPRELHRIMQTVSCAGGLTQIWRVLDHAIRETAKEPVNALILSATRWKRMSIGFATGPVNWAVSGCRSSCSRKAISTRSPLPTGRWLIIQKARTCVST